MRSSMQHLFSQVPEANIQRSAFNRDHGYKTTFDEGYLIPFYVDEALPGDTFNVSATLFARMATPIVPLMDNMYLETFFFAVPYRLVWDNWQKFNGEQENPSDSTDYTIPQITSPSSGGWSVGSLSDYFGLPTGVPSLSVSSLWHRAYNLIWNEWFRDENLQNSVTVPKGDGPDSSSTFTLLKRGKRHDYFTSCLPWPQKGPGATIPLGTTAPIVYGSPISGSSTTPVGQNAIAYNYNSGMGNFGQFFYQTGTLSSIVPSGVKYPMLTDLSDAASATINSLREAFQIQRLYETDARGGSRYTEILRAHFGVVSPDARLQRPEYLGGSSTRININPVAQTSASRYDSEVVTTPQGNLSAFGTAADSFHGFTKSFVEHNLIIGLVNVRADLTYQQGIPRMFSRKSRFDFYWPSLAHLGEQAVLNKEIYAQDPSVVDSAGNPVNDNAFGYQERWAEYRYYPSQITGKFRSTYSYSLDVWHLAQEFSVLPQLNSSFIQDDPPIERCLAVPSEPHFLFDSLIKCRCVRPMPVYSVPGLIDHF